MIKTKTYVLLMLLFFYFKASPGFTRIEQKLRKHCKLKKTHRIGSNCSQDVDHSASVHKQLKAKWNLNKTFIMYIPDDVGRYFTNSSVVTLYALFFLLISFLFAVIFLVFFSRKRSSIWSLCYVTAEKNDGL